MKLCGMRADVFNAGMDWCIQLILKCAKNKKVDLSMERGTD